MLSGNDPLFLKASYFFFLAGAFFAAAFLALLTNSLKLRRCNLDCLARLRVAARASCAIGNLESAEAEERNRVALLQRILDDLDDSRSDGLRIFLGNPSFCSGCFDKFCLLQENTLFLLLIGINCLVACIIAHQFSFAYRFLQIFLTFFPKIRVFL